jgi:anti-anti-sigma factor
MSAMAPVLTTPDELRLAPEGALDARAAVEFRRAAGPLVAARADRLVVDLRRVTHLDAAGLAAVSHAVLGQRRQGAGVRVLLPLRIEARRVLEMTGLDVLLEAG